MNKHFLRCGLGVASYLLIASSPQVSAGEISAKIRIVDEVTLTPLRGARIAVGTTEVVTEANGWARIKLKESAVTLSVAYEDGKSYRIETYHSLAAAPELTLHVPSTQSVRREAVFSVAVPFGPIQQEARALLLLPQPSYDSGGLNFGHYDRVRLYQDQLQSDGKFSLMAVALDDTLIPYKYGYILDLNPEHLDEAHLHFGPPHSTGIDHDRQLVHWSKQADALNASDPAGKCHFNTPPLTLCGLFPDQGGIFSWVNVWRRGQLFHTPGAFLPARTAGANPLLALPESTIELVGHDDPLGFSPANYARHRFLRYDSAPADAVKIAMPNILIGKADQPGADALTLESSGRGASFLIENLTDNTGDQLDFGKLQMIWTDPGTQRRTIWNQYFPPKVGAAVVALNTAPPSLKARLPNGHTKRYENVQVWLYGSDGVDGYAAALKAKIAGKNPIQPGKDAFQVTRWR